MNSKELIKKLELARVGNGTQTYNDVCLSLNKEETLELLQYVEQLEKENQELKEDLEESFDYNALRQLKINSLEEENTKLKKALDILKKYICISKRRNEVNGNYDISCIYSLGSYKDITKEAYELLEEVLGND